MSLANKFLVIAGNYGAEVGEVAGAFPSNEALEEALVTFLATEGVSLKSFSFPNHPG